MKAGLILTTEQPYSETLLNVAIGGTIAPGGNATYTIGTFTMPCAGTAIAHMKVPNSWTVNNIQQVTCVPDPSTPAPSGSYGSTKTENGQLGGGLVQQVSHVLAQWNGLAAGAVITVRFNISILTFSPSLTVPAASAVMRAHRI